MASFLSGVWGGAIVGAVIGLLVTVLLENFLIDVKTRGLQKATKRLALRRIQRTEAMRSSVPELFRLGDIQTSMYLIEGDGTAAISEHHISILVNDEEVILPVELREWRDEIASTQEARRKDHLSHFWNGPGYAISGFAVSRTLLDEEPEVFLRLKSTDYFSFLATQQLDRAFADGSTPRNRYLEPFAKDPLRVPEFMNLSFGTNVALITSDSKLVLGRRSKRVGSRPGVWNSSANEALSRTLDSRGRTAPNLYDVMRRGIDEELGVESSDYRLDMLAVHIDTQLHQWGANWIARCSLSEDQVVQHRASGTPDKWEHESLLMLPFAPTPVLAFLSQCDAQGSAAPNLYLLCYLALVNEYGRKTVEAAIQKM